MSEGGSDDLGLNVLIDMHGQQVHRDDGFWWKIEAYSCHKSASIPHGVRYNLTLHDRYNRRVFGMDNAHSVKPPKKMKYSGKIYAFDHVHRHATDKGVPYEFNDCYQLLADFFAGIDKTVEQLSQKSRT